ncbi:MAG: DUF4936 family protein [Gammaproteobacteria bacterium]
MIDLYIYYKVARADAPALWPRVQAMQARLRERSGVAGSLRRRPEERDGVQTWMEIYPAVDRDFDTLLAAAVSDARLQDAIQGARHTEVFTDTSPCA